MNKNDTEFLVQKIRTQYTEKEEGKVEELKKLDSKVKKPVYIFSYIFGALGVIIMGAGMSLVMTDLGVTLNIENSMVIGVIIGIIGMVLAIVNIPLHKKLINSRRKKYAEKIISLSNDILNS